MTMTFDELVNTHKVCIARKYRFDGVVAYCWQMGPSIEVYLASDKQNYSYFTTFVDFDIYTAKDAELAITSLITVDQE